MYLIQRYNSEDNIHSPNDIEKIRYFSGKCNSTKILEGKYLLVMGSGKYSGMGILGLFKIKNIKERKCEEKDKELEPFKDKKSRKSKQFRIKVELLCKYKKNKSVIENNFENLKYRPGLGVVKEGKEIRKLLKKYRIQKNNQL